MKRLLCSILISIISLSLSAKAERLVSQSASSLGAGLPTFSSVDQYNAAAHAGSPLGWLEDDSSTVKVDLSFRYYKLKFGSDDLFQKLRSFAAPHIRLANPGTIVLDLKYDPDIAELAQSSFDQKIPLNRYSLSLAGGIPSGIIQAGIHVNFLAGRETQSDLSQQRLILGSDEVSFHLGSQVHELVRLGFFTSAKGYLDSMVNDDAVFQDRYFSGTFPVIGGFIDVSKKDFPVKSNFSLGWGFNRFVYVSKSNLYSSPHENTIQGDSIGWDWRTIGDIPAGGALISPAFQMGYWRSTSKVYLPEGHNYPWERGEMLSDSNWTVSSFGLGFGVAGKILEYVNGNLEYSFKNLSLEGGPAYSALDSKELYHRVLLSIQGNLHKIEVFRIPESMELMLRVGYFNFRQNLNYDTWRQEEFSFLGSIAPTSQTYRYNPAGTFRDSRVIGFSTGLGSTFLDRMFSIDAEMTFLSNDIVFKAKGFEFGIDLTCNLRKK